MPKKTKVANDVLDVTNAKKTTDLKAKNATKNTKSSKSTSSTSKKETTSIKKVNSSKNSKSLSDVDNISDSKKTRVAKKTSSKKASPSKETSTKATSRKKSTTKKASTKKKTTTKKTSTVKRTIKSKKVDVIEYYDLPYRYNETTVKVLAQTPKTLFVYWDISDADRKSLNEKYSDNFFEVTYPVLIVHNETKNYSFEVRINDFANSWYLSINDENCKYKIELGRRFIDNNNNSNNNNFDNYVYIAASNYMDAPNGHILFEQIKNFIYFKNVKTGKVYSKNIETIENTDIMNKFRKLYNIYKEMYKDTILSNPASESLSSRFM